MITIEETQIAEVRTQQRQGFEQEQQSVCKSGVGYLKVGGTCEDEIGAVYVPDGGLGLSPIKFSKSMFVQMRLGAPGIYLCEYLKFKISV